MKRIQSKKELIKYNGLISKTYASEKYNICNSKLEFYLNLCIHLWFQLKIDTSSVIKQWIPQDTGVFDKILKIAILLIN